MVPILIERLTTIDHMWFIRFQWLKIMFHLLKGFFVIIITILLTKCNRVIRVLRVWPGFIALVPEFM